MSESDDGRTTSRLRLLGIGDTIELAENWTFNLYHESRNYTFAKNYGIVWENYVNNRDTARNEWQYTYDPAEVTLNKGMVLKTSRVYIKNGQKDFESITFNLVPRDRRDLKGRFWVKLTDANNIVFYE